MRGVEVFTLSFTGSTLDNGAVKSPGNTPLFADSGAPERDPARVQAGGERAQAGAGGRSSANQPVIAS